VAPALIGCVAGLVALAAPQDPPSRAAEIDALVAKGAPSGDDWASEVAGEETNKRWKELSAALVKSANGAQLDPSAFVAADAQFAPLRKRGGELLKVGSVTLRRAGASGFVDEARAAASTAFARLLEPFAGASDLRFEFKTVGVELRSETEFATRVLYHAFGSTASGRVQQNAVWSVEWARATPEAPPLIRAIEVAGFEELSAPGPLLREVTGAVLGELALSPAVALGSEHWFGRSDACGEWNFLGHNGIAIGDVDADGREDVFVAMPGGLPNMLLLHAADGTVRDGAEQAGLAWLDDTKGALLIDYDNDGDSDLFAAVGATIVVALNDGAGRFSIKHTLRAGTAAAFYSLAAADFDLDGDLDLYATRYVTTRYGANYPLPYHDARNGPPNHLLRNDGEKGFADVTREVGLDVNNDRFSTAASWGDYDGDGDPDLYVSNDFGRNNLYRNDGGRFVDIAAESGVEDQAAGMGVSWGDSDGDGDLDLLVSNMFSSAGQRITAQARFRAADTSDLRAEFRHHALGNSLFVNAGEGAFRDSSDAAGIRMGRWAWGSQFCDLDGDGLPEIVVPNGFMTNEQKDDL
jgi:hypothetical protein